MNIEKLLQDYYTDSFNETKYILIGKKEKKYIEITEFVCFQDMVENYLEFKSIAQKDGIKEFRLIDHYIKHTFTLFKEFKGE